MGVPRSDLWLRDGGSQPLCDRGAWAILRPGPREGWGCGATWSAEGQGGVASGSYPEASLVAARRWGTQLRMG